MDGEGRKNIREVVLFMITPEQKDRIKQVLSSFQTLADVDVSREEGPDCVVSFTTTFGDDTAYDLELHETSSGYDAVLLSSSETPIMGDDLAGLDEDQIDDLFNHVVETLRELEGH
jgi:hypothetical protein